MRQSVNILLAVIAIHLSFAGWVQGSGVCAPIPGFTSGQVIKQEAMLPCVLEAPTGGAADSNDAGQFFLFFENEEDPDNEGSVHKSPKHKSFSKSYVLPLFSALQPIRFPRCGALILPDGFRSSSALPVFLRLRVLRL
ncbi:MAG: hypothetical protein NW218_11160 [Saprospiraceae bacterium]|nr:hypothetical protein [Saprospiraceae bacterium]